MVERFNGTRARWADDGVQFGSRPIGVAGEANAEVIRDMLEGPQPDAVSYPSPIVQGFPSILTSLASDAVTVLTDGQPAAYFPGATVGAGANVRFTAVFASGQGVGAASHLILSNGGIATLLTTSVVNGVTAATYVYAVTADDTATSALTVTGIERDGTTYAGDVAAFLAIDPTIESPSDLLYSGEWYIHGTYGTHADKVWGDYTGKGVTVAVFDNGIEYGHPDLGNVDVSMGYNPDYDAHNGDGVTKNGDSSQELDSSGNDHGTAVAGLIGASRNGTGTVGVAYDAKLYSIFNYYGNSRPVDAPFDGQALAFLDAAQHADIINNSWGVSYAYHPGANFRDPATAEAGAALEVAAKIGRDGLGTIIVQSAGNDGRLFADTNDSSWSNSHYSIVVGASSGLGRKYSFSTPGASVLISAPGGGEITTDRAGAHGYNTDPNGGLYTDTSASYFSGTSGAAPVVSGVVALLLEANPHLGARDVQEILAYSAAPGEAGDYDRRPFFFNGATNWNNGGLRASDSLGFGLVDARAATRLAETWTTQSTWNNVVEQSVSQDLDLKLSLGGQGTVSTSTTFQIDAAQSVDRVDLVVDIDTDWPEYLTLTLTSPDGTISYLVDRTGMTPGTNAYNFQYGNGYAGLHFTLDSTQFMGENAKGEWTLTMSSTSYAGGTQFPVSTTLTHAELQVYGDAFDPNTTYIYTDAYAANAFHGTTLTDSDGGYDTINAAAVSGSVIISLDPDFGSSSIAGRELVIGDTHVWRVFGGDAHDEMIGSSTNPTALYGMRGDDGLVGGAATTLLVGGTGDDVLFGSGTAFTVAGFAGSVTDYTLGLSGNAWTIANADQGSDTCVNVAWALFDDGVFALRDDGTTTRLTGTACDLSLDPALGLALSETGAGFLAYSGALAAYAGELASLVITDANALTLDVAQLTGAAPLLDLIDHVAFSLDDTAAAIGAAFGTLVPLGGELAYVYVTDGGPIAITQAEYESGATFLALLDGDYLLSVAQDDGSTHLYSRIGTVEKAVIEGADGYITSVTTTDPTAGYDQVVKTYAHGVLVGAEFDGVTDKPYTHVVRSYDDGHLVSETRDGFVAGDLASRTIGYDAAGTTRLITSTFTDRVYQTVAAEYDADGRLETRTRSGIAGATDTVTTYYHADGAAYATRTVFDDSTSQLVGSKADDTLSLTLAESVRGRGGADTFVVSADEANGRILDFHRAEGDRIDLSHLFGSAGDAHLVGTAAFGGEAGEIRFDRVDGGVFVQIDLDGNKAADVTFALNGYGVGLSDFVFGL